LVEEVTRGECMDIFILRLSIMKLFFFLGDIGYDDLVNPLITWFLKVFIFLALFSGLGVTCS
jgi:hypothetical protein